MGPAEASGNERLLRKQLGHYKRGFSVASGYESPRPLNHSHARAFILNTAAEICTLLQSRLIAKRLPWPEVLKNTLKTATDCRRAPVLEVPPLWTPPLSRWLSRSGLSSAT